MDEFGIFSGFDHAFLAALLVLYGVLYEVVRRHV